MASPSSLMPCAVAMGTSRLRQWLRRARQRGCYLPNVRVKLALAIVFCVR
jgi:hypothetical protein